MVFSVYTAELGCTKCCGMEMVGRLGGVFWYDVAWGRSTCGLVQRGEVGNASHLHYLSSLPRYAQLTMVVFVELSTKCARLWAR